MNIIPHKIIKCKLENVIRSFSFKSKIEKTVQKINLLTIHAYQFLRLWILSKKEIPDITKEKIHMCFKALCIESHTGRLKGQNKKDYNEFSSFYKQVYSKLGYELIDGTNLSGILSYSCTQVITGIKNNIKSHYLNHIKGFINRIFKPQFKDELEKIKNKDEKNCKKKRLGKRI